MICISNISLIKVFIKALIAVIESYVFYQFMTVFLTRLNTILNNGELSKIGWIYVKHSLCLIVALLLNKFALFLAFIINIPYLLYINIIITLWCILYILQIKEIKNYKIIVGLILSTIITTLYLGGWLI